MILFFSKTHILANFIEDMKSGKLHRKYHFGDDYNEFDDNSNEEEEVTQPATTDKEIDKDENEKYQEFVSNQS